MQKWNERCEQEEILWKQKSRIQWIKEGERNTKFFHRSDMDYRCSNRITKIQDEQGNVFHSHHDITCQLRNHFKLISTKPAIDQQEAINEVVSYIPILITEEQNRALERSVSL